MQFKSHGITDPGKVRDANEDAFFIDEAHGIFAVADGLGGIPGGAEASGRLVELLQEAVAETGTGPAGAVATLGARIRAINQRIAREGFDAHPFTGCGTTLTLGHIAEDRFHIIHVGDSAVFRLRAGRLEKITVDHTLEQKLIEEKGEAARATMPPDYPHTLTRCIGQTEELEPDEFSIPLASGDRLLLCTDGLNKVLDEKEIHRQLAADAPLAAICRNFVDAANARLGPDNITLILLFIE